VEGGVSTTCNPQPTTNNALVQTFNVNNRNQLTTAGRSGTLIVAGSVSLPASQLDGVTVSGTGLSSGAATVYQDGTWARAGASPANGQNSYTAVAQEASWAHGRTAEDSVTVNLPGSISFSHDARGNLTWDGRRFLTYAAWGDKGSPAM
jgi:hypothetical protein